VVVIVPVIELIRDVMQKNAQSVWPWVSLGIISAIFIGFTLLTPWFYKKLFSAAWMEDFHRLDMTEVAAHYTAHKEEPGEG
jgi:hypothetical protein